MEVLINRLKADIENNSQAAEPDKPHERSWTEQTGVLITHSEAQRIVNLFDTAKAVLGGELTYELLRELVMRNRLVLPETKEDQKWWDEGMNYRLTVPLMQKLFKILKLDQHDSTT